MEALQTVKDWLNTQSARAKGKALKAQNFVALFDGPDKRAAAQQLATAHGKEFYAVNLSQVVGKYIGETEKNLAAVFEKAKTIGAVLFFDEADALFGKRTDVRDSHDRYANLEVSYVLQQMESYPGLVILGTASKTTVDPVVLRRFRAVVQFPLPGANR